MECGMREAGRWMLDCRVVDSGCWDNGGGYRYRPTKMRRKEKNVSIQDNYRMYHTMPFKTRL